MTRSYFGRSRRRGQADFAAGTPRRGPQSSVRWPVRAGRAPAGGGAPKLLPPRWPRPGRGRIISPRGTTTPDTDSRMDDHPSPDSLKPKYHRVILKLSGEGFGYPGKSGISIDETLNV